MVETRIAYEGNLDMANVEQFHTMVQEASQNCDRLVIDCSGLEFVDSTGVRALVTLKQQLGAAGKQFELEGLSQDILDILDILGIREMLLGA